MKRTYRSFFLMLSALFMMSACAPMLDPQPPSSVTHPQARAVYHKALAGDIEALYSVGLYYKWGWNGFPKDAWKAADAWELAAKKGHSNAYFQLGVAYANGTGRLMNQEKATRYFRRAARRGNKAAVMVLKGRGESVLSEKEENEAFRDEFFRKYVF